MQRICRFSSITAALLLLLSFAFSAQASASGFTSFFSGSNSSSNSGNGSSEFLPVEEAFQLAATLNKSDPDNPVVVVNFSITPEHYLYRHMFKFKPVNPGATSVGEASFPTGIIKFDKFMKREVETYPTNMQVTIPVKTSEQFPEIEVGFQGCADAGLCYPPTTQLIIPVLDNNSAAATTPSVDQSTTQNTPQISAPQPPKDDFLSALLENQSLLSILGLFFLGGLALTFTPCVLPMIPIVSAIVANSRGTRAHNISLTACYVLAMSATYAVAGMLMGYFGASLNLQARLQSPWLLIPFATLFVLLALAMFGLYELQLPEKLRDKLTNADSKSSEKRQGTFVGAGLAGFFSTLLVSPCVSAPLAGALVYISSTGNMAIGGLSLFALGLGMGTPLMIVGIGRASSTKSVAKGISNQGDCRRA